MKTAPKLRPLLEGLRGIHRTLEGADERIRALCARVEEALLTDVSIDKKVVIFDCLDSFVCNIDILAAETKVEIEKTKALLEPEVVTHVYNRKEDTRLITLTKAEGDIEEELSTDRRALDADIAGRFVQKAAIQRRKRQKSAG
jgi:hypothetical protein